MNWLTSWIARTLEELAGHIAAEELVDGPRDEHSFLKQLPLRTWGFEHCPAIPYWADKNGDPDLKHLLATVLELNGRGQEGIPTAYHGLSTAYTIDNQTRPAYEFLYDQPLPDGPDDKELTKASPAPTELALERADQFTLSWTAYKDVLEDSQDLVTAFADTLTDFDAATESFWPTIANFGLPYNLLVLAKVDAERAARLEAEFGDVWSAQGMAALQEKGLLYEIDMRVLESVGSSTALDRTVRFSPATVTVLKQDPGSKALTPIAIRVWTKDDPPPRVYTPDDNAWLYALQAAKTSITVWGIWLGHVYHWHIVTAAMQMTMFNHLPADHRLYPLLQPQSQSLIDFDFVLLTFLWGQISPPTPLSGYMQLAALLDRFAHEREFFDDDPLAELTKRGLDVQDFTVVTEWDAYPVVGYLLEIWDITGDYVIAVVNDLYASDDDVAQDEGLHKWMAASRDPHEGNIRGLPETIRTRAELAKVLTSILYRVTVHGAGSLNPAVNPALSFVSNYPPCLQSADIPEPDERVGPERLLELLPNTGTIGGMTTFYFTFVYSKPYEPLIPKDGPTTDLYFPEEQQNCNEALVTYRTRIGEFVDEYTAAWNETLARIRESAPGPLPSYAEHQAGQWPLSIEI
jgi:Lipoxygenase